MFLSEYLYIFQKKTEQFKYKKLKELILHKLFLKYFERQHLKCMSSSIPDYFIIKFQDLHGIHANINSCCTNLPNAKLLLILFIKS